MKKFNELKKNVNKFCYDHIAEITITAAAGIWITYFAWTIYDIKNSHNDTGVSVTGSSTYEIDPDKIRITVPDNEIDPDKIRITVPDDVSIDDVISRLMILLENDTKWIKVE